MDINNKEYIEDLTSIRTAFSSILSELKTSEVRKKIELNMLNLLLQLKSQKPNLKLMMKNCQMKEFKIH